MTVNHVPSQVTAMASIDASASSGAPIVMDANASYDEQGLALNYRWVQTAGPTVDFIENNGNPIAYFVAPTVLRETTVTFAVIVSNGETQDSVEVTARVATGTGGRAF